MRKQNLHNHTNPFHFPPLGEVRWGLLFAIVTLLTSCKDDLEIFSPTEVGNEIASVRAEIGSDMLTRAIRTSKNVDYIGRDSFKKNDVMVLTTVKRTEKPLPRFTYENVHYTSNENRAWSRDTTLTDFDRHDRIYWSDNKSGHTFIGYSTPQSWNGNLSTKWNKDGNDYTGQFSYTEENGKKIVDFTVIDTELKAEKVKNANGVYVETGNQVDSIGSRLKNEDLLLTYNTNQKADASGLATTLYYRHALASLRAVIDIQGFAPSSTSQDARTTVHDLVVMDQPWKYKWTQAPQQPGTHGIDIPGWGVDNITTAGDGTVDIKTWRPRPAGEGSGQAKKFTFYSLIVPGKQSNFKLNYKVTYPKYLNPAETQTKNYTTVIPDIDFKPGYTTTILISLNHEGEPVYIGAEYIDWENEDSPDRSDLQKISTFLDTSDRTKVSIANDDEATKDDATWLYYKDGAKSDPTKLFDIYGNDGTKEKPFIIKTARQLLSFAYEVQNGRTFLGQYVKLDSDIYLQKDLSSEDINWPGIGDETHHFDGFFLGGDRRILRLKGNPLFGCIGETAVVDKVNIDKVLGVTGCGVIAHKNLGLICGCFIEGDLKETNSTSLYTGSIVGENHSFIIACAHVGKVSGYGTVGGLVGFNNGTMMACYHSGEIIGLGSSPDVHATIGKRGDGTDGTNKSIAFSCYFDKSKITHTPTLVPGVSGYPMSTLMMQGSDFVDGLNSFLYDGNGDYTGQGPVLRNVVLNILNQTDNGQTNESLVTALLANGGATSDEVFELFKYHFSMNEAIRVFRLWLNEIARVAASESDSYEVETNCHKFTKRQILWLKNHYEPADHGYKYIPLTYPKVQ